VFLYFTFILEYTGREQWLTPRWMILLWAEPVVYLLVFVTNPAHQWLVTEWDLATVAGLTFSSPTLSVLGLLQTLLIYFILLVCLVLLGAFALRSRNLYQKQTVLILSAGLISNIGSLLGIGLFGVEVGLTTVPLFISARGGIIALALFRYDFMDVAPLASDTLIEEMADPVLVLDDDEVLVDYNGAAETTFDLDESLLGKPISGLLTDVAEAVAADRPVRIEEPGDDGSNRLSIYQPSQTELTDQHDIVRGTLIVLRDITAQKRRERKLETLQTGSRELIETTSADAVARVTTEKLTAVLEYPFAGVLLYDDEDEILRSASLSDAAASELACEKLRLSEGTLWDAFERNELCVSDDPALDEQFPGLSLSGVLCYPLSDHGVLWLGRRSTATLSEDDRRFAEIVALTARSALDRAERDAQLARQREQLREQNERLDEFAGVVTHDLRNPLAKAQGFLELARSDLSEEYLDEVATAHDRMQRLIDEVLTLAREGDDVSEPTTVSLESIAQRAWETAGAESATLAVESAATIEADPERLRTVFENLFRNAREHGSENVTITVRSSAEAGWFAVEDDGPGIPPEDRDSVFDRGYTTDSDGTGFGLSIVERIADAHGWTVRAEEGQSGGASFRFEGVVVEKQSVSPASNQS
jgi:signal transduction histidine kinase/PAS domain-containing protein